MGPVTPFIKVLHGLANVCQQVKLWSHISGQFILCFLQDGSDEENCTQVVPECKSDEFQCGTSGQCLPVSWKCDGEK